MCAKGQGRRAVAPLILPQNTPVWLHGCSWALGTAGGIHPVILFTQVVQEKGNIWDGKGIIINTFIEYLICPRHLTSSLMYLNTQRQVVYQAKAILFINDNTVTQIQGCFLIIIIIIIIIIAAKLVLSTSTLQWLQVLWIWKGKQNRLSYLLCCLP